MIYSLIITGKGGDTMELLPKQSVMEFHIDKRIENGHMEVTRETMTIIGAQEGKPELAKFCQSAMVFLLLTWR